MCIFFSILLTVFNFVIVQLAVYYVSKPVCDKVCGGTTIKSPLSPSIKCGAPTYKIINAAILK